MSNFIRNYVQEASKRLAGSFLFMRFYIHGVRRARAAGLPRIARRQYGNVRGDRGCWETIRGLIVAGGGPWAWRTEWEAARSRVRS